MTFLDSEVPALLGEAADLVTLLFTCVGVPEYRSRPGGRPGEPVTFNARDAEDGGRRVTRPTTEPTTQPTHRELIDALTWPVTTERLSIRPAQARDAEAVWGYRRLPEVYEWMTTIHDDLPAYAEKFDDPEWVSKMLVIELDGRRHRRPLRRRSRTPMRRPR